QRRLEQLLPSDVVAISSDTTWHDRAAVFAAAQACAQSGAKLVRLAFPRTEQQVFGNVAILYSRYEFELEKNGRRSLQAGPPTGGVVWGGRLWGENGGGLVPGCLGGPS